MQHNTRPVKALETTHFFVLLDLTGRILVGLVKPCEIVYVALTKWNFSACDLSVDYNLGLGRPFNEGGIISDLPSDVIYDSKCHHEVIVL